MIDIPEEKLHEIRKISQSILDDEVLDKELLSELDHKITQTIKYATTNKRIFKRLTEL